jgi:endonuclease/exonuclease/phosphatase family metal-dependent hydrolase
MNTRITINLESYPHDALLKRGCLTAPSDEWLEAIKALQASSHEVRNSFNKKAGLLRTFLNTEKAATANNIARLYSSKGAKGPELRVAPKHLRYLIAFLRSHVPLRVLTWNVGTEFFKTRQTYPPAIFEQIVGSCFFDIICLQEVLSEKKANFLWVDTRSRPVKSCTSFTRLLNHYAMYVTTRGNNLLVTLIRRHISADVLNPRPVFIKGISVEGYKGSKGLPFAHRVFVNLGKSERALVVANVHLPSLRQSAVMREEAQKVLNANLQEHDIAAGDFNAAPDYATAKAPCFFPVPETPFVRATYLSPFRCKHAVPATALMPTSPRKSTKAPVLDYIGFWGGSSPSPKNRVLHAAPWGSCDNHRHFPVAAKIALGR